MVVSFVRNIFVGSLLISVLSGCAISLGFKPGGGKGVFFQLDDFVVNYFEINAPTAPPVLGQSFTESFKDLIQSQSPLELVAEDQVSNSDTNYVLFEGYISQYQIAPLTIQAGSETAAQNRLSLTIHIDFRNAKDPSKDFTQDFTQFRDFSSDADFASIELELMQEVIDLLTQDIFDKAFGDW